MARVLSIEQLEKDKQDLIAQYNHHTESATMVKGAIQMIEQQIAQLKTPEKEEKKK